MESTQTHPPAGQPRRSSTLRNLAVILVAVLFGYALLETAVHVVFRPVAALPVAAAADSLSAPDLQAGRERAGLGFRDPAMSLHPYLGYVFLPHEERATPGPAAIAISSDGFLDPQPAVRHRASGKLIVGVTGGSVAGQLGTWHAQHLEDALRAHPQFRNVELDFVWLGMPGYHQPQQVFQLSYVLAQGGEFDVLINLDGFNEVAVPAALNAPQGAHPLFPMNWSMVALDVPDTRVRRSVGAVDYLTRERYDRAARFQASFWSYSPLAKHLRSLDDRKLERRITEYALEVREIVPDEIPWFVRGPAGDTAMEALVPECVRVWEQCSRQMQAICTANGVRYLHVLQPNQYDPGSKPLSRGERDSAFDAEGPYKPVVELGYPLLREAGARLREDGIAFHDLSGIFAGNHETLYVDSCCHFNGEGNRIMAEAIAEAVQSVM